MFGVIYKYYKNTLNIELKLANNLQIIKKLYNLGFSSK